MHLTLSVPDGDALLAWAADPQKRQAAHVVFRDANGGSPLETLALGAAYCVSYQEEFVSGSGHDGAYICHLVLSDPNGFTIQTGGPATAFVAPAAREHGAPPQNLDELERERKELPSPTSNGTISALDNPMGQIAPGLAAMLDKTFQIEDLGTFAERVTADLQLIYATPTGKKLLESLHSSGKCVEISYAMGGNEVGRYANPTERFFKDDGTCGVGTGCCIGYNPTLIEIGPEPWATRPPAIALAHELVHAEQAAYGRMVRGRASNGPANAVVGNGRKAPEADIRELEAVGVPPHDQYPVSENKIRSEWQPPQPRREYY